MTNNDTPPDAITSLQQDMALISATYLKLTADAENGFKDVDDAMDRVATAIRTTSLAAQSEWKRGDDAIWPDGEVGKITGVDRVDKMLMDHRGEWHPMCDVKPPALSIAAQDNWTAKRVAELVEQGDGVWRSCSGCHETNDGAETGNYPFNPVFKTYQGAGCHECGGIGVIWDDTDYREMAEFCLNADDPAPSLAAQDGLVEALEELLTAGVPKIWKTYRGDYCVSMMQKEYFGKTIPDAVNAALSAIRENKS